MGKSKDLASGNSAAYVETAGDTMTGNLGIGASPSVPLDVVKAGGGNFVAKFQNTTDATPYGVHIKDASSGANGYPLLQVTNGAGSVAHLKVNSGTGHVTMSSQPSFGAYQSTANYTVGSGWGKMIADGTRWNEGSHYSTTNSRFTAPLAGVYHFTANVNSYSIADDLLFGVALYVNGSSHTMGSRFYSRGAADLVASMSHTVKLSATDYVEIYYYSNDTSHGFSSGTVWNTFSGFLIG